MMHPPSAGNRPSFAVVISPGLWRGFEVSVEPPLAAHTLRVFRAHAEALAFAEALGRTEGWPICDRCKPDAG
jgi:hypothetical protein